VVAVGARDEVPEWVALGLPVPGVNRREMLERYPELEGAVRTGSEPAPLLAPVAAPSERG